MKEDKLSDLDFGENNNNNNNTIKVDPTLWTEFVYRIMTCSVRLFMKMMMDMFRRGGNFFISLATLISNIVTSDRSQCSDVYMYHLLRHLKTLHYAHFILYVSLWFLKFRFFPMAKQPLVGQGLHVTEASQSHSDTPHSAGLLWTSDHPVAETSTWQHTILTRDGHPCQRRDSNLQSKQASGRRPARQLGSADSHNTELLFLCITSVEWPL